VAKYYSPKTCAEGIDANAFRTTQRKGLAKNFFGEQLDVKVLIR
jgi:hypothetical protein